MALSEGLAVLATVYHSLESKFLSRNKMAGPCPFCCGMSFVDKKPLHHVLMSSQQSDEHRIAAATRAGVFAGDFSTCEKC